MNTQKNKYRSYHDSVKIGQAERAKSVPPGTTFSHGTQYLEDDFEQRRTRGIAGYTGKQPLPHQKRPEKVEEVLDPSKLYGRGGSCQRKPWSKGIPGYTGHQPIQEYLHPGSELERHGVYLSIDPNIQGADYNLCPERDFDDDRSTSSPISNHSASSQKVFKNNLVVSNAPEDIARRKMEEALQYGDPQVDHEGSVATLRLSVKYHKAPGRRETTFPKQPVDRPKPGPMAEGKGAWRHTRTERSPPKGAQCDFDWFMQQPKPVDKRPINLAESAHWKNMSEMIRHKGPAAGTPSIPYKTVQQWRGPVAYGGVANAVPTYIGKRG